MGRPVMTLPLFWLLPEAKALALTPDDEPALPKPSLALARAMASALALAAAAAAAAAAVSSSFSFSFLASTAAGIDVVGEFSKSRPECRSENRGGNIAISQNRHQPKTEQKTIAYQQSTHAASPPWPRPPPPSSHRPSRSPSPPSSPWEEQRAPRSSRGRWTWRRRGGRGRGLSSGPSRPPRSSSGCRCSCSSSYRYNRGTKSDENGSALLSLELTCCFFDFRDCAIAIIIAIAFEKSAKTGGELPFCLFLRRTAVLSDTNKFGQVEEPYFLY